MTNHARLSASSSAKWLNCPGSIKAEEPYPNISSAAADEGTKAHEMAEEILKHCRFRGEYPEGMFEYVYTYVDYVRKLIRRNGFGFIEQKVDYSTYAKDGFGTADAVVVDSVRDVLHIVDLKYGFNRVSAVDNTQLMLYALGFLSDYPLFHVSRVVLHIVQPRIDNISVHEVGAEELLQFGEHVRERAALTLQDNPQRIAGEKQCQWCRAKHECTALANMLDETTLTQFTDIDSTVTLPKIETLTDEQRKRILDNKDLITNFVKAVETSVYNDIDVGLGFDGYKIVEGRSIRKWADDAGTELVSKLGDLAYNKKLIGIGAAEKLLSKKEVNNLTIKPVGKPTLVEESDKRQSINSTDMFDKLD